MDLHVVGPLASPVERAAIESITGPREPGFDGHGAQRRACCARSAPPPAAGAPRRPVARRLDQPAGAQRDLPPTERAARRGLRRGQLLRPALAQATAAARRPRLRRHRLPRPRRRTPVRRAGGPTRPAWHRRTSTARRPGCEAPASASASRLRRRWSLAPVRRRPTERWVRIDAATITAAVLESTAEGDGSTAIGGEGRSLSARERSRRPGAERPPGWWVVAPPAGPHRSDRRDGPCGLSGLRWLRRPRAGAGDGRQGGRRRGPRRPSSSGVAERPSRPGASGRPSPSNPLDRTISSATPTSRSRARSRIAWSWSSTPSPCSRA